MALSDYERQVLEQMEADLSRADPELQEAMTARPQAPRHFSARTIAGGVVLAVIGLAVILGGVTASTVSMWLTIVLGVLGFLLMVGGVWLALHSAPPKTPQQPLQPKAPRQGGWSKFVADQQRRWDKRQE